LGEL
jgi:hypothetical protein